MRAPGDKKAATFRITNRTKTLLANAAHNLSRSESDLVETALLEYLKAHNLDTSYVLKLNGDHLVLLKMEGGQPEVVEVLHSNGASLSAVHQELVSRLNAPVTFELVSTTGDPS
jgi:hypothetical protein